MPDPNKERAKKIVTKIKKAKKITPPKKPSEGTDEPVWTSGADY